MKQAEQVTITSDVPGADLLLLGNEAVARGAVEAGVTVLASYPGTPSSEIGQAVIDAARDFKHMYVEWSVNEKVAASKREYWAGSLMVGPFRTQSAGIAKAIEHATRWRQLRG